MYVATTARPYVECGETSFPLARSFTNIKAHKQKAISHKETAGPWRRIFVFFPDETKPSVQWARNYREGAFDGPGEMSIQYMGRYSEFLIRRQTPISNALTDLDDGPHYDHRRIGRTIIQSHPLGYALVLTTLDQYNLVPFEKVNTAVLALSPPGHGNLIFGPVCVLAFEGTTFPGKLRDVTARDFHHATEFLAYNITTPAVGTPGKDPETNHAFVPALKITSCMDRTLIEEAETHALKREKVTREQLRYQAVEVTVGCGNQREWPSAIAFYIGLFWYVREVIGFTDACGVDPAARWLLLSLGFDEGEELVVESEDYGGSLVVFSGDGTPVRAEDVRLLGGYYRGEAGDAQRMREVFTDWGDGNPKGRCVFRETRLEGYDEVMGDCCDVMDLVVKDKQLLKKINTCMRRAKHDAGGSAGSGTSRYLSPIQR